MDSSKERLCRICISSYANCTQLISIFGEDSLWKKITTFADVKIERQDTLPQHVCITCAKNTISACLFKKKCEDADNFFRQQLLIQKIEGKSDTAGIKRHQLFESGEFATCGNKLKSEDCVKNQAPLLDETNAVNIPIINSSHINGKYCKGNVAIDNGSNNNESVKQPSFYQNNESLDGEIKYSNKIKLPFDFESIRKMHEYVQQQLSNCVEDGLVNVSDNEESDALPIIPEIEIITPSDESEGGVLHSNVNCYTNVDAQMKGYQCSQCFQIFEMKHTLKTHMQTVHNTSFPVYECSHCKKTYLYKRFLEKHIRRGRCVKKRRNQTKPMQCSDCYVLFPSGHHLGWHKRTGCPSKTANMPLQQIFKQNIVQYNNFPKRIGARKPESQNRVILMTNNKRKGRTRIKLDAKKIALAKQLILRDATTTVIANELNISRTFAWRLRKNLVNGISLHERVIDPAEEEDSTMRNSPKCVSTATIIRTDKHENLPKLIKTEMEAMDNENSTEGSKYFQQDVSTIPIDDSQSDQAVTTSVIQRNDQGIQMCKLFKSAKIHNHAQQQHQLQALQVPHTVSHSDTSDELNEEIERNKSELEQLTDENSQTATHQQQYLGGSILRRQWPFSGYNNLQENNASLSIAPKFSATASINNLPVNLSVRPISTLQNSEKTKSALTLGVNKKKPRKPNVFIDEEKYALAKLMMTQSASTMEIAKALNVSQMTAWKVRDAIIKGVPLTCRGKRLHSGGLVEPKMGTLYRNLDVKSATDEIQKNRTTNNQQQQSTQEPNMRLNNVQKQQGHNLLLSQQKIQQKEQKIRNQEQLEIMPQTHEIMTQTHLKKLKLTEKINRVNSQKDIINSKRRLKAVERKVRDKEVTSEILELIKEDNNIQYWKVSARLAEKGYAISPSSVCQKLKSLGFHRRWKPGDKTPLIGTKRLKNINDSYNSILANTVHTQITFNSDSSPKNHFIQ